VQGSTSSAPSAAAAAAAAAAAHADYAFDTADIATKLLSITV
jgi:hypothetical protein